MRRFYPLAAALLLSAGCYHAVIETGAAPNGTVIQKDWANSFIDGLIPPDIISTAAQCKNGVSKVETQHSFLNMLAAGLTFGIYTPMTITVTCGTGRMADLPTVKGSADVAASVQQAVELSAEKGTAVILELEH